MNEEKLSNELLKRYLLGDLDQREAELVEARCFAEPEELSELAALRDDLLDAWVRGELPKSEEQKLNARLQTLPALRDKAAFARSLQQILAAQVDANEQTAISAESPLRLPTKPVTSVQRKSWVALPRPVWVAAALSLVLLLGWVGMNAVRKRTSQAPEQNQLQVAVTPGKPATPLPSPAVEASPTVPLKSNASASKPPPVDHTSRTSVVSFVLAAGLVRAEQDAPELVIPAAAKTVNLQLELTPTQEHPQQAVLKNAANTIVWEQHSLRTQVYSGIRVALCDVPVTVLAGGTYQLHLAQSGAVTAIYYFRVKRS